MFIKEFHYSRKSVIARNKKIFNQRDRNREEERFDGSIVPFPIRIDSNDNIAIFSNRKRRTVFNCYTRRVMLFSSFLIDEWLSRCFVRVCKRERSDIFKEFIVARDSRVWDIRKYFFKCWLEERLLIVRTGSFEWISDVFINYRGLKNSVTAVNTLSAYIMNK